MRTLMNFFRKYRKASIISAMLAVLLSTSSCTEGPSTAQDREDVNRQSNYEKLVESQPAQTMSYSPTRATKNFWIETWDEPGKLAYVYLQAANGELLGYYILEGLPVSYCVSLIPPYQEVKVEGDSSGVRGELAPGPSVDGTFASASDCNRLYGKDATTGSYVEYSIGMGINQLIYELPLPRQDVQPLGWTTVEDVD